MAAPLGGPRPSLLTDRYELTMLDSALESGLADRPAVFEVFARSLPRGRRYGVVAGLGRLLDTLPDFCFPDREVEWLIGQGAISAQGADYLRGWRFRGTVRAYREGDLYFPYSPVVAVSGTFAECVLIETLVLSILNYDSAVASAAARMVTAAGGRPLVDMGGRRTHEYAAVAAARAAYVTGFAATSNLAAGYCYDIPTRGTSAHAFTLGHDDERAAFTAQVKRLGAETTLLVDTFHIGDAIRTGVEVAGTTLGGIRIDSGELGEESRCARELLDELGATGTRIVVSGDLDEFRIAELAEAPIDVYGVGTRLVTGSGAPTAGFIYKLVALDDRPVAKRSAGKATVGGRKTPVRLLLDDGTAYEERLLLTPPDDGEGRPLQETFVENGHVVRAPTLDELRAHHEKAKHELPAPAHQLAAGDPAVPTVTV